MFQLALKRGRETDVPRSFLTKLDLFKRKPELVGTGRYEIQSDVDPNVFAMFMTRLYGGESDPVTPENAEQLRALCNELGFSGFGEELRDVQAVAGDLSVRKDLVCVRGRVDRHDVLLEQLQRRVAELERRLAAFEAVPARVESVESRLEATARGLDELWQKYLSDDLDWLRREVSERVRADLAALTEEVSRLKRAEAKRAIPPPQVAAPALAKKTPLQPPQVMVPALAKKTPPHVCSVLPVADALPPLRERVFGNVKAPTVRKFRYNEAKPLNGVIAHLTRECGGNVHEKGVVEVTASNFWFCADAKYAVDLGTDPGFFSTNEPNSWIRYDFKGRRVALTSYSIRTGSFQFPISWVLEVSNDETVDSWTVVDHRENTGLLIGQYVTRNFELTDPPYAGFRFVRLRQTGKNYKGDDYLVINSLELFGTLSPE